MNLDNVIKYTFSSFSFLSLDGQIICLFISSARYPKHLEIIGIHLVLEWQRLRVGYHYTEIQKRVYIFLIFQIRSIL